MLIIRVLVIFVRWLVVLAKIAHDRGVDPDDILVGLSAEETALLRRLLRKALSEVGDVTRTPQRTEKSA